MRQRIDELHPPDLRFDLGNLVPQTLPGFPDLRREEVAEQLRDAVNLPHDPLQVGRLALQVVRAQPDEEGHPLLPRGHPPELREQLLPPRARRERLREVVDLDPPDELAGDPRGGDLVLGGAAEELGGEDAGLAVGEVLGGGAVDGVDLLPVLLGDRAEDGLELARGVEGDEAVQAGEGELVGKLGGLEYEVRSVST